MKAAPIIGTVAVAFLGGLALGLLVRGGPGAPDPALTGHTERRAAAGGLVKAPTDAETPDISYVQPQKPDPVGAAELTPASASSFQSSPRDEPSEPPPNLSQLAYDEGEKVRAEALENGASGHGKVTTLLDPFSSDEERRAFEDARKKRWETRLRREIDIKLRQMRTSIGLAPSQEASLREILERELEERGRLVERLAAKEISATTFDEGVDANVVATRKNLEAVLTPDQLAAYAQLAPKEQVLRDETK